MPNKTTPPKAEAPEQTVQGAPGAIIRVPDGRYKIFIYMDNSKLLDMALAEDSWRNHRVKLHHDNSASESTWIFEFISHKNVYNIHNGWNNDLCLERDNDNVYAKYRTHLQWQEWILKDAGSGFVYIESALPDSKIADVAGSGTADNTGIVIWPYVGSVNQKFRLLKLD